jgi:hypothetical protein
MFYRQFWILAALLGTAICALAAPVAEVPLEQRPWFETRSAHFNIYSCGLSQDVYKLAGRLEQFCKAYSQLAGAQSVDSPPIVVIAFPNHKTMEPFLPLYQGQPRNLAAFFKHGMDENLIVLALPEAGSANTGMEVIYHEYTHLLFRRNDQIWPLWLKEGMAEVYSTFETAGRGARIAGPIDGHLQLLKQGPLMSLDELFAVKPDSPQYNERDRQGMFYAESWLLTHFLMAGDNGRYRARFGQFTVLLRQGQPPVQAFTNAMQASLPAVAAALRRYLDAGVFTPIDLSLSADISAPIHLTTRPISSAETCFRLGDELLRIDRPEAAEARFIQAQKLAPTSPLPEEGLGFLANEREQPEQALSHMRAAIQLGSTSFLAYYICALEQLQASAKMGDRYTKLNPAEASEIRGNLARSVALMPDFGPAQQLFGFFETVQGERLAEAGPYLQRAIQLEPENLAYQLSFAQFQFRSRNPAGARQTLQPLLRLGVDVKLRSDAEELLQQINRLYPAGK